ncbi:2703_t:CDS:2, partial [Cetraspora pellucida]
MTDVQIPDIFEGTVIKRGDVNYESECYQNASSSYMKEDIIRPMAIIKAANDDDVIQAIKYASKNKIAVAVRTGGHQYSGASSTNGKNIQLDLSQTYKDFQWDNEDCTSVIFGISFSLNDFNAKLREEDRFVPHGQCSQVNIGGHIQTGGYGQLARSFGLLSDHVEKFRIITANCQTQWVSRNDDLFFAVLGGSPGNFGVLTHINPNVFRDQDYPNSRGFRAICPYNRDSLKGLLDIMVGMAEDDEFPADYNYCVSVIDDPRFPTSSELTYDQRYNKKKVFVQQEVTWTRIIIIFVQWANLEGSQQKYNSDFVDKIRKAAGISDYNAKQLVQVSDKHYTPMSKLTGDWIVPMERAFNLPYFKRAYSSNSSSERLKEFNWTEWVCDRIDKKDTIRICPYQHNFSILVAPNRDFSKTERKVSRLSVGETLALSGRGVGSSDAIFCEDDRRFLWGSHDLDLSAAQKYYYDRYPK